MNINTLIEKFNVPITIPEKWGNSSIDEEDEYTYHKETRDGHTVHVFQTESQDRTGNPGNDEIIIDLEKMLLTFIGADGTVFQVDENYTETMSIV